ncbi:uncharacterized protein TNCV_3881481 [Trichonephila clavipes]|nr:uncharacterized protein TNCV_3881481 [Trichonephila clavipes]
MSPGRCNTGLTMPRHAEYQIINLILGNITPLIKQCPPEVPVDRWEGVDGLQFVSQAYPTQALLDSSPVSMLANPYGLYPLIVGIRLHVCMNDIPIDVACHRYTLNMQVSSGTKNNSSANEPSCTTITVSFNGVLLVVTGTWRSPY